MKFFYSWQSDRPGKTGRHFVRDCLQEVIDEPASDKAEFDEAERAEPDHDTKGVPGSPNIAETILTRISHEG